MLYVGIPMEFCEVSDHCLLFWSNLITFYRWPKPLHQGLSSLHENNETQFTIWFHLSTVTWPYVRESDFWRAMHSEEALGGFSTGRYPKSKKCNLSSPFQFQVALSVCSDQSRHPLNRQKAQLCPRHKHIQRVDLCAITNGCLRLSIRIKITTRYKKQPKNGRKSMGAHFSPPHRKVN